MIASDKETTRSQYLFYYTLSGLEKEKKKSAHYSVSNNGFVFRPPGDHRLSSRDLAEWGAGGDKFLQVSESLYIKCQNID